MDESDSRPTGTVGFIGKLGITGREERLLKLVGKCIARAGKTLVIVPAKGSTAVVKVGVIDENGVVQEIEKNVRGLSAHTIVYADERLLNRLNDLDNKFFKDPHVTLLSSPLEIELWLKAARRVLSEKGLAFPT